MTATVDRSRGPFLLIAVIVFLAAASLGAYLDWMWWVTAYGGGLLITLAGGLAIVAGGVVAAITRRRLRGIGVVVLAGGLGLLAGQALGPSREPLILTSGTVTMRLESPVDAVASGPAECSTVASETEFAVSGDPNIRLDTPDQPFVSISFDTGDRWRVLRDVPRKDGVQLRIGLTSPLVTDAGKPGTTEMTAAQTSTLDASFRNAGGSMRFADLVAVVGPDSTGETTDLAGTVEWTCSAPP